MNYVTEARFKQVYGDQEFLSLTDRDNDGITDVGVYDAATLKADALIDDTLRSIYVVPFNPVPETILAIAESFTRFYLYSISPNKDVQAKFDMHKKILMNLKNEHIRLTAEPVIHDDDPYAVEAEPLRNVKRLVRA